MTTIKTKNGPDINVLNIWSMNGVDMEELTMNADNDARNELAVVNGSMKPYALQISVMAGELASFFQVGVKSLYEIDIIIFADKQSELRYLSLNENHIFTITRKHFQNK